MFQTQLDANSQRPGDICTSQRLVRTRPFVFFEGRGATERDGSVNCCKQLRRGQPKHEWPKDILKKMRVFEKAIIVTATSNRCFAPGSEIKEQKYNLSFNCHKEVVHQEVEFAASKNIIKKLRNPEEIANVGEIEGMLG